MKPFVFTLQSLYDLSLSREKQQKLRLKRIEERLAGLREELRAFQAAFDGTRMQYARELAAGMTSERLSHFGCFFDRLTETISVQKESIAAAERERQQCVDELVSTRREIKTLEKLRESQHVAYLQEVKKEEEKAVGDIVSFKATAR